MQDEIDRALDGRQQPRLRVTDEERATFIRMYPEGHSIRAIATATGRSYTTVRDALVRAGVPLRPHGTGKRGKGRRAYRRKLQTGT